MEIKPMVSVVVVTYQHSKYIEQCLDSILAQETTFPFEVILSEDESTDGTREICIDYANKYPSIIRLFLRRREDVIYIKGKATGRYNFVEGLKAARGKYIALCEGDDYWNDPNKLQIQFDFLENHKEYVISGHSVTAIDKNNKAICELPGLDRRKDFSKEELMAGKQIVTLSMFFRNILSDFPVEFYKSLNGDTFLVSLLGHYGKSKYHDDIKSGIYRLHHGGMWTSTVDQRRIDYKRSTFMQLYYYHKKIKNEEVLLELSKKFYGSSHNLIFLYISNKKYVKSISCFFNTLIFSINNKHYKNTSRLLYFYLRKIKQHFFKYASLE